MTDVNEWLSRDLYKQGKDPVTVAEELLHPYLEIWFEVTLTRLTEPAAYPAVGELTPRIAARRLIGALLSAGWTHPLIEDPEIPPTPLDPR